MHANVNANELHIKGYSLNSNTVNTVIETSRALCITVKTCLKKRFNRVQVYSGLNNLAVFERVKDIDAHSSPSSKYHTLSLCTNHHCIIGANRTKIALPYFRKQ